ncbi:ribosome recycling factor domain-containing protein [Camillea tinctor]|nr:ribosome recycling factor domain-containing protein [Camillea tinctor]
MRSARTLLQRGIARPELATTAYIPTTRASIYHGPRALGLRSLNPALSSLPVPISARASFHSTPTAQKKGQKSRGSEPDPKTSSKSASPKSSSNDDGDGDGPKHPPPDPSEPLEFPDVLSRAARHEAYYREVLKRLRSGGRFNPDAIGALMVQPDRKSPETYPLRELAQVIPRGGRTVSLLVHEAEYIRGVMSAVQASEDFNQQPQRSADNELELVLRVEAEGRDEAGKRVKAACHEWRDRLRSVRQRRDKLHATWQKEKLIVPDLKKTADRELDKLIKAKMVEIDTAEKEALKAVESGK